MKTIIHPFLHSFQVLNCIIGFYERFEHNMEMVWDTFQVLSNSEKSTFHFADIIVLCVPTRVYHGTGHGSFAESSRGR